MKKVILLLSLIGVATSAVAADWILVARGSDNSRLSVDKDSIIYDRANRVVTIWTLKNGYQENFNGQIEVTSKTRSEYDCKKKQTRLLSAIYYDEAGRVIDSISSTNFSWHHIAPDTVGESVLNSICTNPPQVIGKHEEDSAYTQQALAMLGTLVAAYESAVTAEVQAQAAYESAAAAAAEATAQAAYEVEMLRVPEKKSTPRATPHPAGRPAPQRQRTPESRPIVNRL